MKRIIALILAAGLAALPCFAQRDVKTLNRKSAAQVKAILGTPEADDFKQSDFPDLDQLTYDQGNTVIRILKNHPAIDYFGTNSSKYCVLSDYVTGGFKVGDTLSKLKSFDFAKSRYGRNKPGNALKPDQDPEWYNAYQEEGYTLSFKVLNGKVVRIVVKQREDAPFDGYHNPYCPFK